MISTHLDAENRSADSADSTGVRAVWPLWVRLGFRFSCMYWALYMLPTPGAVSLFDLPPWPTAKTDEWISWPLKRLSHWAGVHVFHFSGQGADWHPTGSGDTAMNFAMLAVTLVLALAGTAIWTAIDERRGRREYQTAYAWLRLLLRFTLAVTLLEYGYAKIFPSQFGLHPRLFELNERYGDSTPMHVLWFFMGLSRPYAIFGGLMEAIPGVLLMFRRTSTVGLLGSIAVMANVVAMNFCYDVPVKLYSVHLLLMSVFLLLPDMWPMWDFFVRRRDATLTGVWVRKPERKPLRIAAHVLQAAVVLCCAYIGVQEYHGRLTPDTQGPLRGAWAVDSIEGWTKGSKLATMAFENDRYVFATTENSKVMYLTAKFDAQNRAVAFTSVDDKTRLQWEPKDAGHMQMQGTWTGAPLKLTLHRTDPETYVLTSTGFHWIQERAFNH